MGVAFVGKGGSGNKIQGDTDTAFLREQAGEALLACFGRGPAVRAMEQGRPFRLDDLGPGAALTAQIDPGFVMSTDVFLTATP